MEYQNKGKSPLVDYFLIFGFSPFDIPSLIAKSALEKNNIKVKQLETYTSNKIFEKLPMITNFIFPEEPIVSYKKFPIKKHSFTLQINSKTRHVAVLAFPEKYTINSKVVYASKALCFISSHDIYSTMFNFLEKIYDIISFSPSKDSNGNFVYIKQNSKYTVMQEKQILEFYLSFILNILTYEKKYSSILVNYPNNNSGKNTFAKYHISNLRKEEIPYKEYNICSLALEKISPKNLIKIYTAMLMGFKILIIFDDYTEINLIIQALLTIIYPLSWKQPVISFLTKDMIGLLDSPVSLIAGVHSSMKEDLKKITEDNELINTLVYELGSDDFCFNCDVKEYSITNEIENFGIKELISLVNLIKEKKEANDEETFDNMMCLNYKFVMIFFEIFVLIIKNIENCIIKKEDIKNEILAVSAKKKKKVYMIDYFNFSKFQKDTRCEKNQRFQKFITNLSSSMMFNEFLFKFIFSSHRASNLLISKMIVIILNSNDISVSHESISDLFLDKIKQYVKNYYDFTYISMDPALEKYYKNLQGLSISTRNKSYPCALWYPLEIYKIMQTSGDMSEFLTDKAKEESIIQKNYENNEEEKIIISEENFEESLCSSNIACHNISLVMYGDEKTRKTCSSSNWDGTSTAAGRSIEALYIEPGSSMLEKCLGDNDDDIVPD